MTGPLVTWLHAPGHAGSIRANVIAFAFRTEALIIDWSEMYWNVDELKRSRGPYEHFVGRPMRKDSRGRVVNQDVVISIHKDADIVHTEEFFVSKEIKENVKYNPVRYGKAAVIKYAGQIILIVAWHPQPKPIKKAWLVLPSYRRGVARVEKVQRRLERQFKPDLVLNGGDLQLGVGPTYVYPNKYAKRNGMRFRKYKIDWQMWKGLAWKCLGFDLINPAQVNPKMDHHWTILHLQKEGKS